MKWRLMAIALLCVFAAGCAPVKPWQKGKFTKAHMVFDPEPLDAKYERHVEVSKEGSAGGYGVGAGGCGCN